jgi:hypothetical protein
LSFTLPETLEGQIWECVLDTSKGNGDPISMRGGDEFDLRDRSLAVLFTRQEADVKQPVSRAEVETLRRESRKPEPPVPHHTPSAREV